MMVNSWALGEKTFEAVCATAKKRVLELGSGTGSIELAKKFDLLSIEDNPVYVEKYKGGTVAHVPLNGIWYNVFKLKEAIQFFDYDFIIVDAPAGSLTRLGFYFNYEMFNKVPFLIDDSQREYEALMVKEFEKMGMKSEHIDDGDKRATLLWAD